MMGGEYLIRDLIAKQTFLSRSTGQLVRFDTMKKVSLGKIIENTVESKIKFDNSRQQQQQHNYQSATTSGSGARLNLSEYYKTFDANKVARHTTYDVVGKRDYSKIDKLVKKF
ncbi:cyun96 [Cyclophragma undans nucleopolyhedrovirus]|uniref:Cyun96 n=1 Tax=Cyclophragma undans nucleopolyhedrovirus TaxID=1906244 RepID=A0A288QYR8_9ABAC|nr:cyun96 [Cyclophragma undans nucleopolyhedrovirus]AOT85554.1 cyun96 [Cyclophragma undans nucleopolyhedrovirus]